MADRARPDVNLNKSLIVVSNTDGVTPVTLYADPATHALVTIASGGKLVTVPFDYIGATYPDTSTEVYTYKTGGSGGNTVATVTVVYSDATTKQIITSVTKT